MSKQSVKPIIGLAVSAPGKITLHGEYAVVYGKMALVCSLNLRTFLKLQPMRDNIVLTLENLSIFRRWTVKEIIDAIKLPLGNVLTPVAPTIEQINALRDFLKIPSKAFDGRSLSLLAFFYLLCSITYQNGTLPGISIHVSSELPISSGLGSSASYAVCLASSFLTYSGNVKRPKPQPPKTNASWSSSEEKLINLWASVAEKIIHDPGNSLGIDSTISTFGGALSFSQGKITFLQKLPKLRIMLINTKIPCRTKALGAHVKEIYEQLPDIVTPIFESIEAVSEKCQTVLLDMAAENEESSYEILENLIDMNHNLLILLGVSHENLDKIQQITGRFGIHSKLTGAGGGGCCIALIKPGTPFLVIEMMKEELKKEEFVCSEPGICMPGALFYEMLNI